MSILRLPLVERVCVEQLAVDARRVGHPSGSLDDTVPRGNIDEVLAGDEFLGLRVRVRWTPPEVDGGQTPRARHFRAGQLLSVFEFTERTQLPVQCDPEFNMVLHIGLGTFEERTQAQLDWPIILLQRGSPWSPSVQPS
jgi:hypothetical protein